MTDWETEKVCKRDWLAIQLMREDNVPEHAAIIAVAIIEQAYPDEDWSVPEKTLLEWVAADEEW